jgi:hypothetical protein
MRRAVIAAISAGVLAIGGWVYAQQQPPPGTQILPPARQVVPVPTPGNGTVMTGPDIGVRIEGSTEGRVIGTLVVRAKDGTWVPVQLGRAGVHRLETN